MTGGLWKFCSAKRVLMMLAFTVSDFLPNGIIRDNDEDVEPPVVPLSQHLLFGDGVDRDVEAGDLGDSGPEELDMSVSDLIDIF